MVFYGKQESVGIVTGSPELDSLISARYPHHQRSEETEDHFDKFFKYRGLVKTELIAFLRMVEEDIKGLSYMIFREDTGEVIRFRSSSGKITSEED